MSMSLEGGDFVDLGVRLRYVEKGWMFSNI